MINAITIDGRMVDAAVLHEPKQKQAWAVFTLAHNDKFRKQATFITIKTWGGRATFVCKYLGKGSYLIVHGKLFCEKRIDKKNKRAYYNLVIYADVISAPKLEFDNSIPPPPIPDDGLKEFIESVVKDNAKTDIEIDTSLSIENDNQESLNKNPDREKVVFDDFDVPKDQTPF
jgi:single-stranded DNA-binding protein